MAIALQLFLNRDTKGDLTMKELNDDSTLQEILQEMDSQNAVVRKIRLTGDDGYPAVVWIVTGDSVMEFSELCTNWANSVNGLRGE